MKEIVGPNGCLLGNMLATVFPGRVVPINTEVTQQPVLKQDEVDLMVNLHRTMGADWKNYMPGTPEYETAKQEFAAAMRSRQTEEE